MKANELMLGDLLKPKNVDSYFKVGLIGADSIWDDTDTAEWDLDEIEPIPLTPEILEKNGFEARGYEKLVLEADEDCFALQKGGDGINAWWWEMFSFPIIPINYVHELQHALRLCGIEKTIEL